MVADEPVFILCAVRWYLRYSLSRHDVEELLEERGLNIDHTAVRRCTNSAVKGKLPCREIADKLNHLTVFGSHSIRFAQEGNLSHLMSSADRGTTVGTK